MKYVALLRILYGAIILSRQDNIAHEADRKSSRCRIFDMVKNGIVIHKFGLIQTFFSLSYLAYSLGILLGFIAQLPCSCDSTAHSPCGLVFSRVNY